MDRTAYFKARFERLEIISNTAYHIAAAVGHIDRGMFLECDGKHPAWEWKGSVHRRVMDAADSFDG
jgi:hypothetical protein